MSFSHDVKTELAKAPIGKRCCQYAECYGILLYCNTFSSREIKIITENTAFAQRLCKLFKKTMGFSFDSAPADCSKPGKMSFSFTDSAKLKSIFDMYGYSSETFLAHHINHVFVEEDCCQISFLRGAFFAGGSVTDPAKRYHLELVTDHYSVCREMYSLLLDVGFSPKETSRSGNYITYFKQSNAIEDFLTTIGAPISAMEIMQEKIEKQVKNEVMRQVNCDTANVKKIVAAAQEQLESIRLIECTQGISALPEKLQETAKLRVDNPELSLSELALMMTPPVTKSCMSHRMRNITEIAAKLKKN